MITKAHGADIAAVVLAVLLPLVGFVYGLVRRSQWKAGGMQPPRAATAAVVLGVVFFVLQTVAFLAIMAYVGYRMVNPQ